MTFSAAGWVTVSGGWV